MTGPLKSIINTQYNIPRFVVAEPGKQNRACTGDMRITPGVWEPIEFLCMNVDGVPLNLTLFDLFLVFWYSQTRYELLPANLESNTVMKKQIYISDVYAGTASTVLSDQDTLTLFGPGRAELRWSIYIQNQSEGTMFLMQITSNGDKWGNCYINNGGGIPTMESVNGMSLTP